MTTAVTRNSTGLVDALFDSIDRLNKKEIDAEHARAISHSARAIVGIATLELDFRRFAADHSSTPLKSLTIEADAKKQ